MANAAAIGAIQSGLQGERKGRGRAQNLSETRSHSPLGLK